MPTFFAGPPPRLFAHRGASGETPENTLIAFQRAVALGMEYAELDVHVSRNGVVVVSHDATSSGQPTVTGRSGSFLWRNCKHSMLDTIFLQTADRHFRSGQLE